MENYHVYIDEKYWGNFKSSKSKSDFRNEMQDSLKNLHPINMSEEGAIEYRKRYENSTVHVLTTMDLIKRKQ
jgi:antirestriction protein